MYNNKQDFVPPLVDYGIVYLTNTESFLYFFQIKLTGSLVIILLISYYIQRKGCTEDSLQQTILSIAYVMTVGKYMLYTCNIKICCCTMNKVL